MKFAGNRRANNRAANNYQSWEMDKRTVETR